MPSNRIPDLDISPEMEQKILNWLYDEMTRTLLARQPFLELWLEVQEFYEKTTLDDKIDFPWEGAAHIMIALMPTYIEQAKAKLIGTLFAPSDPFSTKPLRKDFSDFAKPMRRMLTWASEEELNFRPFMNSILLESLKLGNGVGKAVYVEDVQTYQEWDPTTEQFIEVTETLESHPLPVHVSLPDFLFPLHILKLNGADWLGDRVRLSENQLLARGRDGRYIQKAVDKILPWEERQRTQYEDRREDHVDYTPSEFKEWEVWEVWFQHPIVEGGPAVKQVWSIHLDSRTALRKQHNHFPMQMHPYVIHGYELRENRVYANGIGRMVLPYQKEVSIMHNQRLDAATITNAPIFKRKADALGPDEIEFRVGAAIPVDEMDDLEVLFTGNPLNSTITEEQHTIGLLQQRIGMQDYQTQQALAGAQATTVLQIMQESARRFDEHVHNARVFMTEMMVKLLLLYQKYYPRDKAQMILGEDGVYVEQLWEFPQEWIVKGMGVSVTATTSSTSKELDRQNKLSLLGALTQYYGNLTQYLFQAFQPGLPPELQQVMFRIVHGLTSFVEDILEDFEIRNASELAIAFDSLRSEIASAQEAAAVAGAAQPPGLPPGAGLGGGAPNGAAGAGQAVQQS